MNTTNEFDDVKMVDDMPEIGANVHRLNLDGAEERFAAAAEASRLRFEKAMESAPEKANCIACGSESILDRELSFENAKPSYSCLNCKQKKRERVIGERIERSGIPLDVRDATIENFITNRPNVKAGKDFPEFKTPEQFKTAASAFLKKGHRNLFFAGTAGIGKGHLAAAIAIHFIREMNWHVAWVECAKLFRDYHRAYADDSNESMTDRLGTVSLLVLDEICLRDLPADGEEILFAILDRRHKEGRPTIMLGNKPAKAIREWLGERIVDRLRSGGVSFCYGEWESMRGKGGDGANANEF